MIRVWAKTSESDPVGESCFEGGGMKRSQAKPIAGRRVLNAPPLRQLNWFLTWMIASLTAVGCTVTRDVTNTARTPVEQLLISHSIQRSLTEATVPIPPGETVVVETNGLTADQSFAGTVIKSWLGKQGLFVHSDTKAATYLVRVNLYSLGTQSRQTFFGIPPIASTFIPLALPELAFYKAARQWGYMRFSLDIFENESGRFLQSTPLYDGTVYFNNYTALLLFTFRSTDLVPPPP